MYIVHGGGRVSRKSCHDAGPETLSRRRRRLRLEVRRRVPQYECSL